MSLIKNCGHTVKRCDSPADSNAQAMCSPPDKPGTACRDSDKAHWYDCTCSSACKEGYVKLEVSDACTKKAAHVDTCDSEVGLSFCIVLCTAKPLEQHDGWLRNSEGNCFDPSLALSCGKESKTCPAPAGGEAFCAAEGDEATACGQLDNTLWSKCRCVSRCPDGKELVDNFCKPSCAENEHLVADECQTKCLLVSNSIPLQAGGLMENMVLAPSPPERGMRRCQQQ